MRQHQPELSTSAESVVDNVGHERAINPFGELFHQAIHYLSMSLQIQYRGVVKAFGDTHIVHHFEASFQLIYRQKKDIFLVDDLVSADLKIAVALRNLDNPLLILRRIDITILQRHEVHCAREVDTKRLFRYTLFLKVDTHDIFTSSCFTKVDIFQLFSGISFSKVDTPL